MASDTKVFDAACRQSGIIQVDQPMELLDLSAVFSSLPLPKGKRVAIMTLGGGCEFQMHSARSVFSLESYVGLVEAGVGLLPAGGGLKEIRSGPGS